MGDGFVVDRRQRDTSKIPSACASDPSPRLHRPDHTSAAPPRGLPRRHSPGLSRSVLSGKAPSATRRSIAVLERCRSAACAPAATPDSSLSTHALLLTPFFCAESAGGQLSQSLISRVTNCTCTFRSVLSFHSSPTP